MDYYNDCVKNINIAYIGGGSRGWAWGLMSDLAREKVLSGTVRLYDIDNVAAEHNAIIGNKLRERQDILGKWKYEVSDSLEKALTDADFVIISILPGTFKEMESDVHAPEKYGIYQSVGDTVGPGGIIRGLRIIPMYVEIAEAIKKYSKDAWVINYTNPMTLCVKTLYEVFPEIKAFGCCHEVFGTQKLLASAVKDIMHEENVLREDIKINVLGINHFTWIDKASYKGTDLLPIYKEFSEKYYKEGFDDGGDDNWMNNSFKFAHKVKFDLFKKFGLIAAAGDRHLAEFVPGKWYLKDPDTVKAWKFGLTTVKWRMDDLDKRLEKSRKLVNDEIEFEITETGEDGVKQIKALLGMGDLITNVNMPNRGQISNLPIGSVVETNALFRRDYVSPIFSGALPANINSIVSRHVYNVETTLKAGLNRDKELAFSAFINDPLLTCSVNDAEKLFNYMLKNTEEYLPKEFIE